MSDSGVGRHERAHQRRGVERIADPHLRVGAHEAVGQLPRDALLDDDPPRRRAALPGRADRAEQDRARRQIEVRVLGDDDRVVAAELEDGAAEPLRHRRGDVLADLRGAGERDERQPRGRSASARRRCGPGRSTSVKMPRSAVIGRDAVGDVLHRHRAERRRPGGLPHHRIAAHRGERGVPRPHRHREVERRDDARPRRAGATAPSSGAPGARTPWSGRRAAATGRSRSRRCRSSPALRRAPRRGSSPSRGSRDRRAAPSARGARCRGRARSRRASAPAACGTPRTPRPRRRPPGRRTSAVACTTCAIGSPVVGLCDTSSLALGIGDPAIGPAAGAGVDVLQLELREQRRGGDGR